MTVREEVPFLRNRIQFLMGILVLVAGVVIYVTDRSPDAVYFTRFFGMHLKLSDPGVRLLGQFGERLPAFFHVLSFSLMTSAFAAGGRKTYLGVCAVWFFINFGFELGQKYKLAAAGITPEFFLHLPFFESTRAYFLCGTFDWLDIVAAAAGTAAAYLFMIATKKYHS
jgi:hypothetical protein